MDPNVLVVVMDSVRAANVSLYGHDHDTTPFLRSFAEGATVYDQARAPGCWSLPSHVSMFTGHPVAAHGITEPDQALEPGTTVFHRLREAGYGTAVFSENPWLTYMDVGLTDPFDTVEGPRNLLFEEGANPTEFTEQHGEGNYLQFLSHCLEHDHPLRSMANGLYTKLAWDVPWLGSFTTASTDASAYAEAFLDWEAERGGPWAACLNLMDAHTPYRPSPRHDHWGGEQLRAIEADLDNHVWPFHCGDEPIWKLRALEGLYDGAIRQMDAALERIVTALAERGRLEETLVVVTADHGEGFGEPCELRPDVRAVGHEEGVHERQLHVPLVVKFPGEAPSDAVPDPVTLTRLPAVIRSARTGECDPLAARPDGPVLASSHGLDAPARELAARYCGEDRVAAFTGEMLVTYDREDGAVRKTIKHGDDSVTLRVVDARHAHEVGRDEGDRVERAFADVDEADVRRASGSGDVDGAAERRLRELGYMK